jgi:hypothetical protein
LLLRGFRLGTAVTILLLSTLAMPEAGTTNTSLIYLFVLATGALLTAIMYRAGLLALAVAWLVWTVLANVPMVPRLTHWSAVAGNWTISALVGLTLFGFYAARAGRPTFGASLRE